MIVFDSKKQNYKKPFGAVLTGEEVQFHIDVYGGKRAAEAYLAMEKDGEEPVYITFWEEYVTRGGQMESDWEQRFTFRWRGPFTGLFFYHFKIVREDGSSEFTGKYQITVYETDSYSTPAFLQGGLMYQIFPDRFARGRDFDWELAEQTGRESKGGRPFSLHRDWGEEPAFGADENGIVWNSDFFGGSLRGIEEQLNYFSQLGVTVLYLNPIFRAFSNHRYDTGDYTAIDPLLGTNEDFRRLCAAAMERGIRVVFDGVFNHTGCDSLYFNKYGTYGEGGAYQSKESPCYPWYSFSQYPDNYDSWWGIDTLPAVNEAEPSYLDYILQNADSIVKYWLACGASGVRLDVADELPDLFLDELRRAVKETDPQAAIIGEVWEDASNKTAYGQRRRYFQGKQLDSVMNYPLKDGIIAFVGYGGAAETFADIVESLWENYPKEVFYSLMNILGTHDTLRIFTVFLKSCTGEEGSYETAVRKLSLAVLLWAFMPGIPCIYYGDETGMEGEKDPFNRRCFDLSKANEEVADFYEKALTFYRNIPELRGMGSLYTPVKAERGLYAFARTAENTRLIIAVNRADDGNGAPAELSVCLREGEVPAGSLAAGSPVFDVEHGAIVLHLPPLSGIAVYLQREPGKFTRDAGNL